MLNMPRSNRIRGVEGLKPFCICDDLRRSASADGGVAE